MSNYSPEQNLISQSDRFSDAYLNLRKKFMTGSVSISETVRERRPKYDHLTEKQLRVIWYDGLFEHRKLKLTDGRRVVVLYPGIWNTGEGPDFRNVQLRVEDQVIEGDMEIHLRSEDWIRHGHDKDSKYNNVVLHLVLHHTTESDAVINEQGKKIPHLELKDFIPENAETLVKNFELSRYPYWSNALLGECGKMLGLPTEIKAENLDFFSALAKHAGDGRILLKGEPAARVLKKNRGDDFAFDEIDFYLYSKILEGLGYALNKSAMRTLAVRVPYDLLRKLTRGVSGDKRMIRIEAALFGSAGLIPKPGDFDSETQQWIAALESEWRTIRGEFQPMSGDEWIFRGNRPHNFPTRRLAGFGALLNRTMDRGLFRTAIDLMRSWDSKTFLDQSVTVREFLSQPGLGYFGVHAKFGGKKFSRPTALIGEERALNLWANIFLPLLVQWSRFNADESLEKVLHRFWIQIPVLSENQVTKIALQRFLGAQSIDFPLRTEQSQQGIIQIFQDFCDTKPSACIGCSFPRLVSSSK